MTLNPLALAISRGQQTAFTSWTSNTELSFLMLLSSLDQLVWRFTGTFVESCFQVCQVPINSTELTRSALDKKGLFVCHIVEAESAQKSRCKQRDLVEMS
jgi:hypothetical protein